VGVPGLATLPDDLHGAFDPEHLDLDAINVWLDHLQLVRPDCLIR